VEEAPRHLVAAELVFFVQLVRLATRATSRAHEVRALHPPEPKTDYRDYFGVAVSVGPTPKIVFSAADATRPFPTANEKMWEFFEPSRQTSPLMGAATPRLRSLQEWKPIELSA
jgi:hypothetical protein